MRGSLMTNSFRDPYGKEFYSESFNRNHPNQIGADYSARQILSDSMSRWESTQTFIQPFKRENFSFTTKNRGKITFRVRLEDFNSSAQLLMLTSSSHYVLKAGFFWYQRYTSRDIQTRGFTCGGESCSQHQVFRLCWVRGHQTYRRLHHEPNRQGRQVHLRTQPEVVLWSHASGVRSDSGIFQGDKYQDSENPGVPGYTLQDEVVFSKLMFSYRGRNTGNEMNLSEVSLTVEVESEAYEDLDKIVGLPASPAITGVFFRVFAQDI